MKKEIAEKKDELKESGKIDELSKNIEKDNPDKMSILTCKEGDDILEKRLEDSKAEHNTYILNKKVNDNFAEFNSPERAQQYADLAFKYMNEYRTYLRKANTLYDDITRKRQPESRMSEVTALKKKAEAAKREGEKYNRYAQMELNRF